jgi:deoxyribodipyrimidine photo-lyase
VVWCAEDFGPYGAQRDAAVARDLEGRGARLVRVGSPYAVAPGLLLSGSHRPYQVFTPFSKAWLAHGWSQPLNRPRRGDLRIAQLPSEKLVTPPEVAAVLPLAGEDAAQQRLVQFLLHLVDNYDEQRDRPDLDGTSRLSPYLKFGCLHPRQVLHSLDPTNRAHHRYVTELCWREFYADVLFHRPDSAHEPFRDQWRDFEVDSGATADARFDRWCHGQTGYPIVDAGMRQLLAEGWMHNRVRMIVASFLVKDLHVDWRRGAKWFMQHLVDGDLASNQHGWQWVAGTGTDASPYFRIFNPLTQAKRFDPHGDYVRRWVPELATMPELTIHEPSRARPATLVADAGYPSPIVDHARERTDALLRYQKLRTA